MSTDSQDLEKNKAEILMFAHDKKLGHVEFVQEKVSGKKSWRERALKGIMDDLDEGDRLIVPEMSRLGRSMLEIMQILAIAQEKGINVYAVKGDWCLDGTIQSKVMAMAFSLASEIERDLISQRTREALKARKKAGVKLGRPRGPGRSKLDKHSEEIVALLKNGSTKSFVARRYQTTQANLYNWLKKNKIDVSPTA